MRPNSRCLAGLRKEMEKKISKETCCLESVINIFHTLLALNNDKQQKRFECRTLWMKNTKNVQFKRSLTTKIWIWLFKLSLSEVLSRESKLPRKENVSGQRKWKIKSYFHFHFSRVTSGYGGDILPLSQVRLSRKNGGFITNVNVELIRQPKGQNWPTVPPPLHATFPL